MSTSYIAVLGRQPELGLIELQSVLGTDAVENFGRAAILSEHVDVARLGGIVKLARLVARQPWAGLDELELDMSYFPAGEDKLTFGLSYYGPRLAPKSVRELGIRTKKALRDGRSVRYLAPQDRMTDLSAAQLKFNGIPEQGAEVIIVKYGNEMIIGVTEQIQDIDAYAVRDHGRPARSATVGMLPPKLAQLLINTTHGERVYDPFCGTGVILQEAWLMGREAAGSDLASEMVEATRTNMAWLAETHGVPSEQTPVRLADARQVVLPEGPVSVVSEGYLGPNLMHMPNADQADKLMRPLRQLYIETLRNLARQLPSGAEVSICAPAWLVGGKRVPLPLLDVLPDLGYTTKVFDASPTALPVYGRADQPVGRALYLLTKV